MLSQWRWQLKRGELYQFWQSVRHITMRISIINQHWCSVVSLMSLLVVFVWLPRGFHIRAQNQYCAVFSTWQVTINKTGHKTVKHHIQRKQNERKQLTANKRPVRKSRNRYSNNVPITTVFKIEGIFFPLLIIMIKDFFKFVHRKPDWYLHLQIIKHCLFLWQETFCFQWKY